MAALEKVSVPYGGYWCTPFSKWQGSLAHLHSIQFAAHVAKAALADKDIAAESFDHAALGITIPQQHSFYGLPWLMKMIGNESVGGTTVSQACATSARVIQGAALELEQGMASASLCVTADRTSNTPVVVYPNPQGMAGSPDVENWVLGNFSKDPLGGPEMVGTAENCARDWQVSTEEQHEVVARRWEQYEEATANDHAFQKKYMTLPFEVPDQRFRKTVASLSGDEGIRPSTREGLAKLKPVVEGGTVTFGGQTHPADGNAGLVLTTPERARELARDPAVRIRLRGFGLARTDLAYMPEATIPATRRALEMAGLAIGDLAAIKSHNPFAVNDIVFARATGCDLMAMNNYGSSLVWGHPQGPTGMRSIIELIEELVLRGGGHGLFQGCAAGDTAMAVVLTVGDAG